MCVCSRANAVRSALHQPVVISPPVNAPVVKTIEVDAVTSVHSATTDSRAVCRVTVIQLVLGLTNVTPMSASVMMTDNVLARYITYLRLIN